MVLVVHGLKPDPELETELIRVRLLRGEKLGKRDLFVCDPYAVVRLEKTDGSLIEEVMLEKKKKTRAPQWNSVLTFRANAECVFRFMVFDENRIRKDDLLGSVLMSLEGAEIPIESQPPRAYPLVGGKHKNTGSIWISMHLLPPDESPSESTNDLQASSSMPEGWEEREDGNGRTFYVNHRLRSTQWERPRASEESVADPQYATRRRRDDYETRVQVTEREGDDDGEALANQLEAIDAGMRANFNGGAQDHDEDDDLVIRTARSPSQRIHSHHSSRNGHSATSILQTNGDLPTAASANGNGVTSLEELPLPPGWDKQVAPNGRTFFIDHSTKTTTWTDPRTGMIAARTTNGKTDDEIGALPEGWEQRVHSDGRVFFIDHNNKKTQWEDPRFENESIAGPAVPYSRDYKRKVEYLRTKLPRVSSNGKCDMVVHRDTLFEDSYRQILEKTPSELRHKLWIEFVGETGLDYGGVTREWFFLLSHEIFNPYYGLFEYSATDNYTLQINPHSATCNPDHLRYFYFIGKVIGMAIYHGKLLDAFFIRPFYKMMLNRKISLFDMESVDNAYYNSLIYVKDNDPTELELTFSVDESVFGETQTVELIEDGKNVLITEENKEEYIEAVIKWRFVKRVEPQMQQILRGIHEVVPCNLLRIFDANELELLMCGLQKIDVKDWRANTIYKGGYGPSSQVIHNFWKCILTFDNEMRSRVLQFVSGTSRVPMNGFRELYGSNGPQKFTIERWGSADMLPRAHTCFNRLDLPPYQSFNELRQKLITAIENSEIFSGVD